MFRAPRGTADLLPEDQKYWRYIESKAVNLSRLYGFGRIDTPVFEDSNLFIRSVGEGTDIVEKEMYTFEDRGATTSPCGPKVPLPFVAPTWSTGCTIFLNRCACTTSARYSVTNGLKPVGSGSTTSSARKSLETPTPRWTRR